MFYVQNSNDYVLQSHHPQSYTTYLPEEYLSDEQLYPMHMAQEYHHSQQQLDYHPPPQPSPVNLRVEPTPLPPNPYDVGVAKLGGLKSASAPNIAGLGSTSVRMSVPIHQPIREQKSSDDSPSQVVKNKGHGAPKAKGGKGQGHKKQPGSTARR